MGSGSGIRPTALGLVVALSFFWSAAAQEPTEPSGGDGAVEPTPLASTVPEGSDGPEPQGPGVTQPSAAPPVAARQAPNFCDNPEMTLSRSIALQSEEVAWRAVGLMPGSRVSPRAIDVRAPTGASVFQLPSTLVNNQCEATATFFASDLGPGTYVFTIVGTTPRETSVEIAGTFSTVASSRPPTPTPVPRPLPAPTGGLRASALNANTIRLDWSDNSTDEAGFRIDSAAGQFRTGANVTTLNVGGLRPLTAYCLSIYSSNDVGESFGGAACAFTPEAPPRP